MKENTRIDTRLKARLKWVLEFLYIDIDSLPRADFYKLLVELGTIIRQPSSGALRDLADLGSPWFPWADSKEMREDIKKYQQDLKKTLEFILARAKGEWNFSSRWDELQRLGPDDPKFASLWDEIDVKDKIELEIVLMENRVFFEPTDDSDALTYALIEVLNPFSLNDIRKCEREDCGRYFLKATKKEKRYCSNKCAWVMASRKRRENNAEKERERKRLSYERRKRRELGANVKIQRRTKGEE